MTTQDEALKQNDVFREQFTAELEAAKAAPGGLTPEVVARLDKKMTDHVEWLASHGILFPNQVMGR